MPIATSSIAYLVDPRARSRPRHPLRGGNYSAWLGQKQKRMIQEGRDEEAASVRSPASRRWISASPS